MFTGHSIPPTWSHSWRRPGSLAGCRWEGFCYAWQVKCSEIIPYHCFRLQVATAAEKVDELIVMSGIQDRKQCLRILATSPTAQSRQFPDPSLHMPAPMNEYFHCSLFSVQVWILKWRSLTLVFAACFHFFSVPFTDIGIHGSSCLFVQTP